MKILSTLRTLRSVILNLDIRYFVNKKVLLKTSKYKIFQNCSLSVDVVNSKPRCTAPLAMSPPPHSAYWYREKYHLQSTTNQRTKLWDGSHYFKWSEKYWRIYLWGGYKGIKSVGCISAKDLFYRVGWLMLVSLYMRLITINITTKRSCAISGLVTLFAPFVH